MKNYSLIYWALALVFLNTLCGCKKLIEIDLPKDELTTEKVFADSTNAVAALLGIYNAITGGFSAGAVTTYNGLSADELYTSSTTTNIQEFFQNSLTPTNSTLSANWSNAYYSIYKTNAIIDGVEKSKTIPSAKKRTFLGEAKILRAYFYFNLLNLYGRVPLVLSTDYNYTMTQPQSSESDIYEQIVEDLSYAMAVLPSEADDVTRANKDAAIALLSRVYLFLGEYDMARSLSTVLINSNRYTLESSPNNVFLRQSSETIWALEPVYPGRSTQIGFDFVPISPTRVPAYVITDFLYGSFDVNDLRKEHWIGINIVNDQSYPYPLKYKMRVASDGPELERYVVLRLAEQYLIRAEAEAQLQNSERATEDINVIRRRAGLEDFPAYNDTTLILREIVKQRKLELMCEWGHRWFDLKRMGRINDVLQATKPYWDATDALYPIPQVQLDRNPFLTQNDGY